MSTVKIKAEEYVTTTDDDGIKLSLSPYDVPREIKPAYNNATGILSIDFIYIDEEKPHPQTQGILDSVTMRVGQHSGKILGFDIDTRRYRNLTEICFEISHIAATTPGLKFNQRENYRVVGSILNANKDAIWASA